MPTEVLTLYNLGGGVAAELFQEELEKVLKNIADPNAETHAKRKISITLEVVPNEKREIGSVQVFVKTTLAPLQRYTTTIYMGREGGEYVATEHNPQQLSFQNMDHIVEVQTGEDVG